jgi:antitoxin (DNA-binding transcriptional repressor) of toxin-antitoxin stability system
MRKAPVRDLRYDFRKIEGYLRLGEEVEITKRRRTIARLIPERVWATKQMPDFLERLRSIFGDKTLSISGAELISQDRCR